MQLLKKLAVVALLGTIPMLGADVAVLRNGFEIRHQRREVTGDKTRLYTTENNYVEVPSADIAAIQQEEYVAPPAAGSAATTVPASSKTFDVHALAGHAADQHQIDQDFIEAVIRAESAGNPKARSHRGAEGLMQLMPQTATRLGVLDPFDPAANVDAGTRELRALLERYNGDAVKALAAYNAGPHRVAQFHGIPPYAETQAYVRRIIRDYNAKKLAQQRAAAKLKAATKKTAALVADQK